MMDIGESWDKALRNTEIIRTRVCMLETFAHTEIPYIFLAESSLNTGDTVVRTGKLVVEKPAIILPGNPPQLSGFDFEDLLSVDSDKVLDFLLIRGVRFPSLRYNNQVSTVDIYEDSLKKAIAHYKDKLQRMEDVHTGLIAGPEDCWQFSVLIFIGIVASRSAQQDIRRLFDGYKNN
ncbi:MAG: hypothetical protein JW946_01570 [Candidatus Omnitrophica bacterium]|nr:hypothetical protein [Candidatus Omnitrophota bacterium]